MKRYLYAALSHFAQTAACSHRHVVEARLIGVTKAANSL
jgi:hypothetical protein